MMDTSWAQIAFKHDDTWRIIGGYKVLSGRDIPMPTVKCPVVDNTGVNNTKATLIICEYIFPHGVSNVEALLKELVAIGAKVL
jgi:hypothetical protein